MPKTFTAKKKKMQPVNSVDKTTYSQKDEIRFVSFTLQKDQTVSKTSI